MDHLEMTEQLRGKANVSYEEARDALEQNGWDMLEAMVVLEKQGRINDGAREEKKMDDQKAANGRKASENLEKVGGLISRLVEKGNRNRLEVRRDGAPLFSMPLTVLVLAGLLAFWLIFPGMLVGWLFGWRYSLQGQDFRGSREYQPAATGDVR